MSKACGCIGMMVCNRHAREDREAQTTNRCACGMNTQLPHTHLESSRLKALEAVAEAAGALEHALEFSERMEVPDYPKGHRELLAEALAALDGLKEGQDGV